MTFSTRNSYYLQISQTSVIMLYIYLDAAHVRWMTDYVLQKVLADLKSRIGAKLISEANLATGKKGSVEVCRGDTYQFAYFLRKTDHRHVVLVKSKSFVTQLKNHATSVSSIDADKVQDNKQSRTVDGKQLHKDTKRKRAVLNSDHEEWEENGQSLVRSRLMTGGARSEELFEESREDDELAVVKADPDDPARVDDSLLFAESSTNPSGRVAYERSRSTNVPLSFEDTDGDLETDEKTFKPTLELRYSGFSIYGKNLCVVVEPFPALPLVPRTPSYSRTLSASPFPSLAPPSQSRSGSVSVAPAPSSRSGSIIPVSVRTRTPLFRPATPLVDDTSDEEDHWADYRSRSVSAVPGGRESSVAVLDSSGQDDEQAGMMSFSQVMRDAGGSRRGEGRVGESENDEEGGEGLDDDRLVEESGAM